MSSSPGAGALPVLQQATATIPMVAAYSTDPVGNGLVASLAHPGATPDWFSSSDDTSPKQLELLITVAPGTSRVGLLGNPNSPTYSAVFNGAQKRRPKGQSFHCPGRGAQPGGNQECVRYAHQGAPRDVGRNFLPAS